jgi:hypothetical protein
MSEDAKWHWAEGTKYAIEGAKSILIVNGAASVSVLTFIGNMKLRPAYLIYAMILFSVGALFGVLIFIFAYATQLCYGNNNFTVARRWHIITYVVVLGSVLSFVAGICSAGRGFFQLP